MPSRTAHIGPESVEVDRPIDLVWGALGMYDMVAPVLQPRSHVTSLSKGNPFQVGVTYLHVSNASDGPPITYQRILLEVDNPSRFVWLLKGKVKQLFRMRSVN